MFLHRDHFFFLECWEVKPRALHMLALQQSSTPGPRALHKRAGSLSSLQPLTGLSGLLFLCVLVPREEGSPTLPSTFRRTVESLLSLTRKPRLTFLAGGTPRMPSQALGDISFGGYISILHLVRA